MAVIFILTKYIIHINVGGYTGGMGMRYRNVILWIQYAAENALRASGKFIPWQVVTISIDERILD